MLLKKRMVKFMDNDIVRKVINHAIETVPHYKKVIEKSMLFENNNIILESFPVLKKDTIINDEGNFISKKYIHEYQTGKLIMKKTSGSTGKCLNVYWSLNDDTIANLEAWKYRYKWYNISVKDKYISFHTTLYYSNRFIGKADMIFERSVNISFNKNLIDKNNIHVYLRKIKKFEPIWMLTQPSVLHIILSLISAKELKVLNTLKYIELTGEYLTISTLKYFKESLPNVKFSNMYGTTETGCVALECPYGHLHILKNAIVEIFDDELEHPVIGEGNIVLTSLRNLSMLFIRYNIGDKGEVNKSNCECGFEGFDIKITLGREGDIINLPNDIQKPCYILLYSIEEINDEFNCPITQFYFIQKSIDCFEVYISIKDQFINWRKTIEESLIKSLKANLYDNANYTFIYVLNKTHEGNKLKFFSRKF